MKALRGSSANTSVPGFDPAVFTGRRRTLSLHLPLQSGGRDAHCGLELGCDCSREVCRGTVSGVGEDAPCRCLRAVGDIDGGGQWHGWISASAAPRTARNSVLSEVGSDGTVTKQAALRAFTDLIGPLPGVPVAPMRSGQVLDGTFAVDRLRYWDELSAKQRAAIKR